MRLNSPPILGRKIRFAIVGCGRISKNHVGAIGAHSQDAELVEVCDTDPEALESAQAATGAKAFSSLDDMLAVSQTDIVVLSSPSGLHAAQTIDVARSGRHVMTEKPMATRWRDARAMVDACDKSGVRLFVVKQNRMNATLRLLKKAIVEKRFGRIFSVGINVFWCRPQEYYDSAAWRGTWEFDGGALMNQASHYIDLLDWLIGPVESVQAYTATLARTLEVEDSAAISVRWRSGALGTVNVSMLAYPKNFEGSITIIGEHGTVRLGGVAANEIQHWEFADVRPEDREVKAANYATTSVYGFGHPLYYENVIQVLRGAAEPLTDGREGLRSLELLVAAYTSARDGRRVALPLDW
jgi:UDP-N-acetyl-2-amino-2-deoxyglucuronate dehydrogenase